MRPLTRLKALAAQSRSLSMPFLTWADLLLARIPGPLSGSGCGHVLQDQPHGGRRYDDIADSLCGYDENFTHRMSPFSVCAIQDVGRGLQTPTGGRGQLKLAAYMEEA